MKQKTRVFCQIDGQDFHLGVEGKSVYNVYKIAVKLKQIDIKVKIKKKRKLLA